MGTGWGVGGKGNLLCSVFSCHIDEVPRVLPKAGSHSETGMDMIPLYYQVKTNIFHIFIYYTFYAYSPSEIKP